MQGRTHAALNFATALAGIKFGLFGFFGLTLGHGFLIFVLIGTILPDLDHHDSTIGKKFPIISWFTEKLLGKRGLFHSIFGLLITLVIFYLVISFLRVSAQRLLLIAFAFGFILHLIGDSVTINGVKWLPGFKAFHLKGPIKTGSLIETILFIILIMTIGFLIADLRFSLLKFI